MGYLCNNCNSNSQEIEEVFQETGSMMPLERDPWLPYPIHKLRKILSIFFTGKEFTDTKNSSENGFATLVSNICYNLQYLHFMEISSQQLYLTNVLQTQQLKIYCLIGGSIIEALMISVCEIDISSNVPSFSKIIEKNLISKDDRLQKYDRENGKLGEQKYLYKIIDYIRQLRDKIHLYVDDYYTDYHNFQTKHQILIKYVINEIIFLKTGMKLPFIEITDDERKRILDISGPWKSFIAPMPYVLKGQFETFEHRNKNRS